MVLNPLGGISLNLKKRIEKLSRMDCALDHSFEDLKKRIESREGGAETSKLNTIRISKRELKGPEVRVVPPTFINPNLRKRIEKNHAGLGVKKLIVFESQKEN